MSLTSERLRHAQQILDEALAKPAEERTAFVGQACGGDTEVLAEVTSLLTIANSLPPRFMQTPEPVRAPYELVGKEVAGYRIEGIIGSGGMGTVYAATQDHPRRKVALKVMRASVVSRAALRRFQFEVEVLGRLRHPNIAQIYQAGTSEIAGERVPFFALEYIPDARPITAYADEAGLSLRQRLELLAKVCDAVHHGHQKGIIHRDLKPANLLVDAEGEPKVIDFGVARATDSDLAVTTQRTDVGQMIGTLAYMSPEQCEAELHEIDTRSDVYSLGVVLYELLCGRLPYDLAGTSLASAARTICEKPPAQPSRIDRRLRGDVELIVLKALEKDRTKRYQSAGGLAEDIRRYLRGEPTQARAPTAWTRSVRWVARHPIVTTAAACLFVGAAMTVGGSITVVWFYTRSPGNVTLREDRHLAQLTSVSRMILREWRAEDPAVITFAGLVERPAQMGSGKLVVVGLNDHFGTEYPGPLCAFDAEQTSGGPLWYDEVKREDFPAARRDDQRVSFSVSDAWLFDVFPEAAHPGKEIVVVYSCIWCDRLIRIYDLGGTVLYQVWLKGSLATCYWMRDAGLLVFAGLDGVGYWADRGYPELQEVRPFVLFAIKPAPWQTEARWLNYPEGHRDRDVAWYRCLLPPDKYSFVARLDLLPPEGAYDPGRFVQFNIRMKLAGATVGLFVDESGQEVPGSRTPNDQYTINGSSLPDHQCFSLDDLPPITSQPARE